MNPSPRIPDQGEGASGAFHSADSVDMALERLSLFGEDMRILAGGTDLVIQGQRAELSTRIMLHVGRIDELRHVTLADSTVRIGALVTHSQLQLDTLVRQHFGALREAAATVGGWQTQAVGTIGGNVCNASPAADTIPPLLVADAQVELASVRGTRTVRLEDFVLGRRSVDRRDDELVTALELPQPVPRTSEVYLKIAPRLAMEVALVGLAVRLTLTAEGAVSDVRVAVCAVGPRPFRARSAEQILVASLPGGDAVAAAGEMLAREASPIDDARATARYRRRILPALLGRAVDICRHRVEAS